MKSTKKANARRRSLLVVAAIILIVAGYAGLKVFGPNTSFSDSKSYLYIKTGSTYEDVLKTLHEQNLLTDISSFDFLAKRAGYPTKVKAGKYRIDKGMSSYHIVRMLRAGRQEPVKLIINKLRTRQDLIRLLSSQLEADSGSLKNRLRDNGYLSQFGLDSNTAMCLVIPDTYEFWWNTSAEKTLGKLGGYYIRFWTGDRKAQAQKQGLSVPQVVTVASIVEEETNNNPEKSNIASVYINRYKKGMKLQADPTVKFAIGDFSIRRVTGAHTAFASPYNTYYTSGLPPGPICTPSVKTVEAVLHTPQTGYLYFCAKEDFSGTHRFAAAYSEHMENARRYQQALNARGIR